MNIESNKFLEVAATNQHDNWDTMIMRETPLYIRDNDIRTEFGRDYTRILHCLAYRRLKHKTQVFFDTHNDHVCTRIEHVNHVDSVSFTIANFLGLNTELTRAIAIGHDLGHAPFGHQGEWVINKLAKKYLHDSFWHEKHGLYCVDNLELLVDPERHYRNLNLTYAVRDGIVSHCGEIDQNEIFPRTKAISLNEFDSPGKYQPYTWEACIVKVSDKIAYIGRDIDDAVRLKIIGLPEIRELYKLAHEFGFETLNTTLIMHELITDLCIHSSPSRGLALSQRSIEMMNSVKAYNYKYIYKNKKLDVYKKYVELVLNSIFTSLYGFYTRGKIANNLHELCDKYPKLTSGFYQWLAQYSDFEYNPQPRKYQKIYGKIENKKIYAKAILDYIAAMTDQHAVRMFDELTSF